MTTFDQIENEIERGLSGKNNGIPMGFERLNKYLGIRKRIYTLIIGPTGCLAKGTKVLMYDGSFKNVEDIIVGDKLMGPDSNPRTVLELKRGVQQMFWIRQNKGQDYKVNGDHILHLRSNWKEEIKRVELPRKNGKRQRKRIYGKKCFKYLEVSVHEAFSQTKDFFHKWKGYKTGVEFANKEVAVDPYFLGLWLGDGTSSKPAITTPDIEIIQYLHEFCEKHDLNIRYNKKYAYTISADWKRGCNIVLELLRKYNLLNNKHIPQDYLINSRENRLLLLAGLLDSDGHKDKEKNCYSIVLKSKELSEQIVYLSRSLGFYTTISKKVATLKRENKEDYLCDVYRIFINGNNLCDIPCKIERKKINNISSRISDGLSTGIQIEKAETDNFYGFTLDGDNLFLLEDFTVTHNSGKSSLFHDAYILNPYDWFISDKNTSNLKFEALIFNQERSRIYTVTKWVSRKIFIDHGVLIPVAKILGWWEQKLTNEEHDYVKQYREYIENMIDNGPIRLIDGGRTPGEIAHFIKEHAEKNGKIEKVDEYNKIYIPNDENVVTIVGVDHAGLIKRSKEFSDKKGAIDQTSGILQHARDFYGYSPVVVTQLNRNTTNPALLKAGMVEPILDNIKESGKPAEDCDVAISVFDPIRFDIQKLIEKDEIGYMPYQLRNESTGAKFYRRVKILKSTYGEEDIMVGMGFHGAIGMFKELKKANDMLPEDYEEVISGDYFKTKYERVKSRLYY